MKSLAVVFGGTSGYGAGIAAGLESFGSYEVIRAGRTTGVNVMNYESVRSFFEVLTGRDIAIVVYSAGCAIGKDTVEEGEPENWATVIGTNAVGLLHVAKCAIPFLKKTKGHLISIGSIANEIAYAGAADYCASKAAQTRIMETLRFELLGTGIRQTSLEVGLGNTEFQRRRYNGDMEKAKAHYADITQLDPADIAEVVEFIVCAPPHINFDSMTIKPLEQAHHGHIRKVGS